MELAAILIALVGVVVNNWLWLREIRKRDTASDATFLELFRTWEVERQGLLNRIQHPRLMQPVYKDIPQDEEQMRVEVDDEYDLVGEIEAGSQNGAGDEAASA